MSQQTFTEPAVNCFKAKTMSDVPACVLLSTQNLRQKMRTAVRGLGGKIIVLLIWAATLTRPNTAINSAVWAVAR